jgi:hypothetical protein
MKFSEMTGSANAIANNFEISVLAIACGQHWFRPNEYNLLRRIGKSGIEIEVDSCFGVRSQVIRVTCDTIERLLKGSEAFLGGEEIRGGSL